MSRAVASISIVLGAGFTTLSEVITDLTVFDGPSTMITLLPLFAAFGIAAIEAHQDGKDDDLPDGLDDEAIRDLGGEPDA